MKTATAPSFLQCIKALRRRIAVVRARRLAIRTTTGIAASFALLVAGFTVEAVLDDLVELPWVARALIFVCNVGGSFYLLWRDCLRQWYKRPTDDAIALMVEHAMPVFKTRFIASIQLARHENVEKPHALVRALLAETAATAAKLNFHYVIKTKRMMRALLAATAAAGVSAALIWFAGAPASVLLLKRALLFTTPLPHKTRIVSITGDKKIGFGEDFKLEVAAEGVIPKNGQVTVTTRGGTARQFTLEPVAGHPGSFSALIHNQQDSFSYWVKLNDDTSQVYHVSMLQRPSVVDVNCVQEYPAYTKLPPVQRHTGDLTLLAGSTLKITARASIPVSKASLHLAGLEKDVPMRIDPNQTGVSGEIPIPAKDLTGFSIHLVSTEGADSGETAVYRIDVVLDQPPTVKIVYPLNREELATQQAKLLVAFEAQDDYGIAKVELHYTIDQGPEKVVPFDLGGLTDKVVKRQYNWELDKLQPALAVGNVIEFWLTVADNNDVTGPGIGTSEHYQTKIVTPDEKRLDLANRLQDTIGGVKEVTDSEQELNKTLGGSIFAKPKEP